MIYNTLSDIDFKNKKVLLRVDYNVAVKDGKITDDSRILASLETIRELLAQQAKVILCSHFGRPKGKVDARFSLLPVAQRLAEILQKEVIFPSDSVGMEVQKLANELKEGQILLLENLRFYPEEESNDTLFSQKLAQLADVYVNDAFGAMHRAHASTAGVTQFFKEKAIGRLVEKEISFLGGLIQQPKKPFVVILGGAKVSDKIAVIENLMNYADAFLIGGGMAYTFLKAQNFTVGKSLVDDLKISQAKKILERAHIKGVKFLLPVDSYIAEKFEEGTTYRLAENDEDWKDNMGLDIGDQTVVQFGQLIKNAGSVFWNGPMGVFEFKEFQRGTFAIAKFLAESNATTIVGGGDSLAAIHQSGYADQITFLSTGGGASLEFLEGKELPGLAVLKKKKIMSEV